MSITATVSGSTVSASVAAGSVVSVNGQTGAVSLALGVPATGVNSIVVLTAAAYAALSPKVATTLYIVTPT